MTKVQKINRKNELDMTHGPMLGKILLFTLPIIGSNILQCLFNTADMIVVGRFEGDIALGAVGTNSALISLITALFIGLATGAGVCVSVALGAQRERDTSEIVHTAMMTALLSGVLVAAVGYIGATYFLSLLNVEGELLEMAARYLRVYSLGAPALMVYNFGFGIMRSLGDTRRPLFYMLIAGLANVGFNILFVAGLGMGVVGVALGTVISVTISAVLVVLSLCRYQNACRLSFRRLGISPRRLGEIMRIGIPAGIRGILFGISNTLLQASINSLGPAATSGSAAAGSLENFLYFSVSAFGQTVTVFAGQNYGAGKPRRVRRALAICAILTVSTGVIGGWSFILLRRPLLSLYLEADSSALTWAYQRLVIVGILYFLEGLFETLAGALQGIKISVPPTVAIVFSICGFRLLWIFLVFPLEACHTIGWLFACYPISWLITSLILFGMILYYYPRRCPLQRERLDEAEGANE